MEKIFTENAPKAAGPYSQAVKVGDFLFVSGQVAIDPKTNSLIEGRSIEDQAKRVLENIKAIVIDSGFLLKDVVKCEIFLTNMDDFSKVNEIYADYFDSDTLPARQCVEVSALPLGVNIEISCIVSINNK